ncbi:MAG TPA: MBL fold metallo-hydrolase [Ktedonobacteraceae bacterium]|nr:MBL fold metallo-hydrolase [Ktedonobacteraceae bacterium]
MKLRSLVTAGSIALGAIGAGLAIKSFLPQRWNTTVWDEVQTKASRLDTSAMPKIEVTFLRCGSVTIPEPIAVRGALTLAPRVISHSAVLVRHPQATFLYDTGLCADIYLYIIGQSLLFRKTLANFAFEQSLHSHLQELKMDASTIDFALLSHLHWDHVSGIPEIPGVPLRINRVEYEAARLGLLDANQGLVRQLMSDNPIELFDCHGPAYEGFRSSYDMFGDGSVVLVPLPGHTAGNTGMFINRSNGTRLFLIGDAAWVSQNYLRPATMHPFIWSGVTSDDATARQTLINLHHFALRQPDVPAIAMHDAAMQEAFMLAEERAKVLQR